MKGRDYPKMIKESVVRGVALWVVLLSVTGALLGGVWIPVLLAADFFARGFVHPRYSLLARLSRGLSARLFAGNDRQLFSTPKRFAAKIGLLLSVTAAVLAGFGLGEYASASLLLLGTFSFLECFLRYCAGCKIFSLLARYDLVDTTNCPNCK
mgnify:FL=1